MERGDNGTQAWYEAIAPNVKTHLESASTFSLTEAEAYALSLLATAALSATSLAVTRDQLVAGFRCLWQRRPGGLIHQAYIVIFGFKCNHISYAKLSLQLCVL